MAAYIQFKDNLPEKVDMAIAMYGFIDNVMDVKPFTFEQIDNLEISDEILKRNVFVGTTKTMLRIFERLNVMPPSISFPSTRTDFKFGTLGEVLDKFKETKVPVFVKPSELKDIKLFDGYVLKEEWSLSYLKDIDKNVKVGYCPVFDRIDAEFIFITIKL